jgi:16S rRNA (adenine1518-N6/adenine1519-N6)-dimethyltransferase
MSNPRQLLADYNIAPKKSLGQNFLHDPNALNRILESAELPPHATILEIGPGTGALTKVLAQAAARVITIETDERLRPILENELAPYDNITIIWDDFLKLDLPTLLADTDYYVVANVPYYITSKIIRKLLDAPIRPQRIVLTVQKEVADRIIAKTGATSLLTVSVQFFGHPTLVTRLNPAVFWPRPDVESAVIRIDVYNQPIVEVPDIVTFFDVVRAGFSQKRKQLKNALSSGLHLENDVINQLLTESGIDARRRAETLTLEEWATLSRVYADITTQI